VFAYLLLAGKDTVSSLMWRGGRMRSAECPLVTTAYNAIL